MFSNSKLLPPSQSVRWREYKIRLYLLSTICVNWPDIWIWADYTIKKRDTLSIVGFFFKLQVDHILYKLLEGLRAEGTERLWRGGHFLFANKKALVFTLQAKTITSLHVYITRIKQIWKGERHKLPGSLAKVDVPVEERLVYKLEILNHPSCYLFSQDVHEH